ncbi:undecaprenyl-phosphate glucose phosphotransferase [Alteromonas aestuariivivens]|uniref:Undecaprenyl-phosphate glucose phosphotransferase n=1 Tax=Alteromonas aestuariivivens TaxID=1938339 RepID=A0A3D8MCB6_9ALTE|nr:undecaprenyl-phosphate glucose phosphotransferase [Alteromonas aestuariivivens]RDV28158.1 undecaprenyl-phosphate glucose phosphotransferase [Alteromonas aestuariivivens]
MENNVLQGQFLKSQTDHAEQAGITIKHQSGFSTFYRLIDISCITLCFYSAVFYYDLINTTTGLFILFINVVAFQLTAEAMDLYRSWRSSHTSSMLRCTGITWLVSSVVTLTVGYFFAHSLTLSPAMVMMWFASTLTLLLFWRMGMRQALFRVRKSGLNSRSAIIIGATHIGYDMALQMVENSHLGIHFTGIYDDRVEERLGHEFKNQIKGGIDDAIELAKNHGVDYIYIALPTAAESRIKHILEKCSDTTANVYIIPNFFVYTLINSRWQTVGNVQALSVYDTPFQGTNDFLKRLEDIIISALILLVLAIPMLIIGAAVKLSSPGPVIFKQKRYGLDGKEITVYKFRSMTTQDNGERVVQAKRNDPRVTRVGAFLRRTSLDELPQFINVLQGRMSIVGPRPHAVAHNEQYRKLITGYMLRHKVRPGITGWAQVNGLRGETETVNKMVKRVEYDLDYMHRWSVWFDMKIILMTIIGGFSGKNAY